MRYEYVTTQQNFDAYLTVMPIVPPPDRSFEWELVKSDVLNVAEAETLTVNKMQDFNTSKMDTSSKIYTQRIVTLWRRLREDPDKPTGAHPDINSF